MVDLLVCSSKRFDFFCDVRLKGFFVYFEVCGELFEVEVGISTFAELEVQILDGVLFLLEGRANVGNLFRLPCQLKLCLFELRSGPLGGTTLLGYLLLQASDYYAEALDLGILGI